MAVYDPRSPKSLAHSGTFNNNTLTMHVGYVGLGKIWTSEVAVAFNEFGDRFREELQRVSPRHEDECHKSGSIERDPLFGERHDGDHVRRRYRGELGFEGSFLYGDDGGWVLAYEEGEYGFDPGDAEE